MVINTMLPDSVAIMTLGQVTRPRKR